MDVRKGDIAFRCNFSTVDEKMVVLDRRAGRISSGTDQLAAAVTGMKIDGVEVIFKESVAHRGALILRGEGLSAEITDTDPHHEGAKVIPCEPIDPKDAARAKTAAAVNEFVRRSYEILKMHPVNRERIAGGLNPANIILPRGAGVAPSMESFEVEHNLKAACVAETGLINGVARYVGMRIVETPGATGGPDSNVLNMAKAIVEQLKDCDFVLCNVKGADVGGHDGKPRVKIDMVAKLDEMIGYLMANLASGSVHGINRGPFDALLGDGPLRRPGADSVLGRGCPNGQMPRFRRAFGHRWRRRPDPGDRRYEDNHAAYERSSQVWSVAQGSNEC